MLPSATFSDFPAQPGVKINIYKENGKNDGKYGLVNKDGTLVVQYQYDDITEQNEYGFVAVKKDGKWGVIDQYGNTVVDPKYEFSDITKITVLGKWHSTEGINTAYFICE